MNHGTAFQDTSAPMVEASPHYAAVGRVIRDAAARHGNSHLYRDGLGHPVWGFTLWLTDTKGKPYPERSAYLCEVLESIESSLGPVPHALTVCTDRECPTCPTYPATRAWVLAEPLA